MPLSIVFRKGSIEDLSKLRISEGLSATAASIEFNVLGMGHEFWIAVDGNLIVGFIVLGRASPKELKIVYLKWRPLTRAKVSARA